MRRTTGYLTAFNACLTVASGQTYLVLPMVTDPAADSASEQPGRIIDAPSERGNGEGHVSRILGKLHLRNCVQAVSFTHDLG